MHADQGLDDLGQGGVPSMMHRLVSGCGCGEEVGGGCACACECVRVAAHLTHTLGGGTSPTR